MEAAKCNICNKHQYFEVSNNEPCPYAFEGYRCQDYNFKYFEPIKEDKMVIECKNCKHGGGKVYNYPCCSCNVREYSRALDQLALENNFEPIKKDIIKNRSITFKAGLPNIKEDKVKYKLTEKYAHGFSLRDLCAFNPCLNEFCSLICEVGKSVSVGCKLSLLEWVSHKTIQNNLSWLVEKGFIEEEAEEWVNLYYRADKKGIFDSEIHETEADANRSIAREWDYIKTIRIK